MKTVPVWIIVFVALATVNSAIDLVDLWSTLAGAVTNGASLAGTTMAALMNIPYTVVCGITVENWSVWNMTDPQVYNKAGYISTIPGPISSGHREAMVTHGAKKSVWGTQGTVSWKLVTPNGDVRVVLTWSVPRFHLFHSNLCAVGITKHGSTARPESFFKLMYKHKSNEDIGFARQEFRNFSPNITYADDLIVVSCTMGTGHKPTVYVYVKPIDEKFIAPSLKEKKGK